MSAIPALPFLNLTLSFAVCTMNRSIQCDLGYQCIDIGRAESYRTASVNASTNLDLNHTSILNASTLIYGNSSNVGNYSYSLNYTENAACFPCRKGSYCPTGSINDLLYININICPAGYYCPDPSTSIVCPLGSYCPEGSLVPTLCGNRSYCPEKSAGPSDCPASYYCPTPLQLIPCPVGYYCKSQLTEPRPCPRMADCTKSGMSHPVYATGACVITLVVVAILVGLWYLLNWLHQRNSTKYSRALEVQYKSQNAVNSILRSLTGTALDVAQFEGFLRKSTAVEVGFLDLGLKLQDGSIVLKGVTGRFRASTMVDPFVMMLFFSDLFSRMQSWDLAVQEKVRS
jgi:hypothetical protein